MIIVHAHLRCRPEHRLDYLDQLRSLRRSTIADDPGCLQYDFWESIEQPGRFLCVEQWADRASLEAHLNADHHRRASAALDQWRAEPARIDLFDADPAAR